MRPARLLPVIVLAACGGKKSDDSAAPTASCDDYVTDPMPSLTPDEYPPGLAEGIEALRNLEGLWRGSHCVDAGADFDIKITSMPTIPDAIEVVHTAPDASVPCGCGADPLWGADNSLDVVGLVPAFTLSLDPEDAAPVDPAVDQREFEVAGALFAGADGLYFRACAGEIIEPYLGSSYDSIAVNLRIQTATTTTPLSHLGDVTLGVSLIDQTPGVAPVECAIDDFTKVN